MPMARPILAEDFGLDEDAFLSFLPLSAMLTSIPAGKCCRSVGAQIYYAEGLEKLASNIEEVRPTMMVVVPRLFEVLRDPDHEAGRKAGQSRQLT
jgi:long-chain acyl-CoA synthetase